MTSTPVLTNPRQLRDLALLVALPAFNEEDALPKLLPAVFAALPERSGLLVVDDGSADRTAALVEEQLTAHPVALLRHGTNRGLAAAMRSIMITALDLLADEGQLVVMDADGSHAPEQIAALRERAAAGFDVVICSRYAAQAEVRGVPAYRRWLTGVSKWIYRLFLGPPPALDLSCGYRLYRAPLLRRAAAAFGNNLIESAGFGVMVEILTKLSWLGARVAEVPLRLRYDLKTSPSRMHLFHTAREYLGLLWRLRVIRKNR